jgi:hypothetical protein
MCRKSKSECREVPNSDLKQSIVRGLVRALEERQGQMSRSLRVEIGESLFVAYHQGLVTKEGLLAGLILLMRLVKLRLPPALDCPWPVLLATALVLAQKLAYDEPGTITDLCECLKASASQVAVLEMLLACEPAFNRHITRGQYVAFYMRLCDSARTSKRGKEVEYTASTEPSIQLSV